MALTLPPPSLNRAARAYRPDGATLNGNGAGLRPDGAQERYRVQASELHSRAVLVAPDAVANA